MGGGERAKVVVAIVFRRFRSCQERERFGERKVLLIEMLCSQEKYEAKIDLNISQNKNGNL